MQPNPTLRKLGYGDNDRVVILHADDIGMCQATLTAYADLVDFGLITSAATMAPCSWFPALAAFCREYAGPGVLDIGVHLTLTCEWSAYRWGPISTRDVASGMIDDEGYFYRSSEDAQDHGDPGAVAVEIKTQVQRALEAGIDLTHIDTHMGTVMHPKYLASYIQTAMQHRLPAMLFRWDEAQLRDHGLSDEMIGAGLQAVEMLTAQGVPLLDHIESMPLEVVAASRVEQAKARLGGLPSGLTHFLMHPAKDTPELRAITGDWPARAADYQAMMSDDLRAFIEREGIHVIGYRTLRDALRGGAGE